jgi:hypothetical protein
MDFLTVTRMDGSNGTVVSIKDAVPLMMPDKFAMGPQN